jgi:glycosyltransferase involved in cell wall biosynthesis
MRVTIVSRDFPPVPSGMGDYSDLLARELARRGHELTVVCAAPASKREGIHVRPALRGLDARNLGALDISVGSSDPDVVLWQYNPFQIGRKGIGPSTGRIARTLASHAPLILVAHELWYDFGRNGARGLAWALAQRAETRAAIAASVRIVVTTEARRDMLQKRYPSRQADISAIRIGANIEPDFSRSPNGFRADIGATERSFVLAHFGSTGDGREFAPAYDALRRLRARDIDARLVCIGRSGNVPVPADLRDAVVVTGVLPAGEVSDALRVSDAYLFCEPAGPALGRKGSLLAAFAHGLPVIAYAGRDTDEGLHDGENVMLVPPDAERIAAAIRKLAHDRSKAKSLGIAARQLYVERFAWDLCAARYEELFTGLGR